MLLERQLTCGPIQSGLRKKISDWAGCLGSDAGADYLQKILLFSRHPNVDRPTATWDNN